MANSYHFDIKTTNDWQPGKRVKALVFGGIKAGKTYGALTFPRPCLMDFDRGIAVARNPGFVKKHGMVNAIYEEFYDKTAPNSGGIVTNPEAFDKASLWFDFMMQPANAKKFDTWIIDTGTTLTQVAQNKAIKLLGSDDIVATSSTFEEAKQHRIVIPKIQDYGAERSMVEQFVDMVLQADKHVLFLCHEKEVMNKQGETTDIVPLLTGKGVQALSCKFDEIWNLRVFKQGDKMRRALQTHPDGLRRCGSRYGVPSIDPLTTLGGIPFEWGAINKALESIRAEQSKQGVGT